MTVMGETEVRLLPLTNLKVDKLYQRQLDSKWVHLLIDGWRPELVGMFVVSAREDGSFVVLDGQHRLAALRHLSAGTNGREPKSAWCEIYFGLAPEQEAEIFLGRNAQKAVHVIDKFRARVQAGEPTACAIQASMAKQGVAITRAPTKRGSNSYVCIQTLERAHEWGILDPVLDIVEQSWGRRAEAFTDSTATAARSSVFVYGVMLFHLTGLDQEGYSTSTAAHRLQRAKSQMVLREARDRALATHTSASYQVAMLLRETYNRTARNRIPEIISRGRRGL